MTIPPPLLFARTAWKEGFPPSPHSHTRDGAFSVSTFADFILGTPFRARELLKRCADTPSKQDPSDYALARVLLVP